MNLTFFSPVEHILTGQLGIYYCISVIYKIYAFRVQARNPPSPCLWGDLPHLIQEFLHCIFMHHKIHHFQFHIIFRKKNIRTRGHRAHCCGILSCHRSSGTLFILNASDSRFKIQDSKFRMEDGLESVMSKFG